MGQQQGADVFFLLMGAILVFAMHGGFAFLEAGTVRHKNQVNALVKILVDFAISTVGYFSHRLHHRLRRVASSRARRDRRRRKATSRRAITLVKFFFLCTFAAAVPAIISGGIAERAKFGPQCVATALMVGLALSAVRRRRLEQELRPAGELLQGGARRAVPRLRRLDRRARLWRLGRRSAAVRQLGARLGRYDRGRAIGIRRRRRSRGSPWAPGCCASAGSAST